jgi:hypothetical protein
MAGGGSLVNQYVVFHPFIPQTGVIDSDELLLSPEYIELRGRLDYELHLGPGRRHSISHPILLQHLLHHSARSPHDP